MKKTFAISGICFVFVCLLYGDSGVWTVSGTVNVTEPGTVYLSLLTEDGFKNHYRAYQRIALEIGEEDAKAGSISFEFTDVPSGDYSFSAFLDRNENGKLDMGMLGPKEPWGNYRCARPRMRGPKWEEIVFTVNGNTSDIIIAIE